MNTVAGAEATATPEFAPVLLGLAILVLGAKLRGFLVQRWVSQASPQPSALLLGSFLIVCAILGKLACAFGVLGRGIHQVAVPIGMTPPGEVGLIFAVLEPA